MDASPSTEPIRKTAVAGRCRMVMATSWHIAVSRTSASMTAINADTESERFADAFAMHFLLPTGA